MRSPPRPGAAAAAAALRSPAPATGAAALAPVAPAFAAGVPRPTHAAAPAVAVARPAAVPPHPAWQLVANPGQSLMVMPGQMSFGGQAASMRTLLGSCVSITLWHPQRRIGGMCHFLLPSRARRPDMPLDGRYGDEAVEAMVALIKRSGTRTEDYHAHLYGGADTLPDGAGVKFNVGERNIERGWSLIDQYGFQLQGVDVGEDIPRTVTLTLATGEVDMKRGAGRAPVTLPPGTVLPPR